MRHDYPCLLLACASLEEGSRSRDRLKYFFTDLDVVVASHPRTFSDSLEEGEFDIVAAESELGWADGYRLLQRVKERFPECPAVLCVHRDDQQITIESLRAGINQVLFRSTSFEKELAEAVRGLLKKAAAFRQWTRTEMRLRSMLNRLTIGVFRATVDGDLLEANEAFLRLFGFATNEELFGNSLPDLLFEQDERDELLDRIDRAGRTRYENVKFRRADDTFFWATLTTIRSAADNGAPALEGMIEDVTEKKTAQDSLREKQEQIVHGQKMEALGRLIGGVAHDLNNILGAITLTISHLAETASDALHPPLQRTLSATERAAQLVHRLLTFAKKTPMVMRPCDVTAICSEVAEIMRQSIDRRIILEMDLPEGLHHVVGDAGQLHQVLLNLCINARDALESKMLGDTTHVGRITVAASNIEFATPRAMKSDAGPRVWISVTDNGVGMSEETRLRVFEPFFTTKEAGKGTGLGLAAAHSIVEQHAGRFDVRTKLNHGSTFSIILPAVTQPVVEATIDCDDTDRHGGSETILIVDDEEMIRSPCRSIMEQHGYRVLEACDGIEALEVYDRQPDAIDLVLLDLSMPRLGGIETLTRLRSRHANVKVVFTSGYAKQGTQEMRRAIESLPCIDKPFLGADLLRVVRRMLDGEQR